MDSIGKWVSSVSQRFRDSANREEATDGTELGGREGPRSALFRCPGCRTVYIDTDKTACSTCDTAVEEVPSTLTGTA